MLVKENMLNKNAINWLAYQDVGVKVENGVVFANAGVENKVQLKTYLNLSGYLSKPLEIGNNYSLRFYFENLREHPITIRLKGINISPYEIESYFKGVVSISGKRVTDDRYLQIQILAHNPAYYVKFKLDNLIVTDGENSPKLWIPAKADLKNPTLYPPDGNYEEIKAS